MFWEEFWFRLLLAFIAIMGEYLFTWMRILRGRVNASCAEWGGAVVVGRGSKCLCCVSVSEWVSVWVCEWVKFRSLDYNWTYLDFRYEPFLRSRVRRRGRLRQGAVQQEEWWVAQWDMQCYATTPSLTYSLTDSYAHSYWSLIQSHLSLTVMACI